jgi:hypothetical protein
MSDRPPHQHPILGELRYDPDEEYWLGSAPLPHFAAYGEAVAADFAALEADQETDFVRAEIERFRAGRFDILVYAVAGNTPSATQNEALAHLLDEEETVCQAVLRELAVAFEAETTDDLRDQAWLRQVEIADEDDGTTAYAGFTFSTGAFEESPTCIIYHPKKGTWWAESSFFEALDLGLNPDPE